MTITCACTAAQSILTGVMILLSRVDGTVSAVVVAGGVLGIGLKKSLMLGWLLAPLLPFVYFGLGLEMAFLFDGVEKLLLGGAEKPAWWLVFEKPLLGGAEKPA